MSAQRVFTEEEFRKRQHAIFTAIIALLFYTLATKEWIEGSKIDFTISVFGYAITYLNAWQAIKSYIAASDLRAKVLAAQDKEVKEFNNKTAQ